MLRFKSNERRLACTALQLIKQRRPTTRQERSQHRGRSRPQQLYFKPLVVAFSVSVTTKDIGCRCRPQKSNAAWRTNDQSTHAAQHESSLNLFSRNDEAPRSLLMHRRYSSVRRLHAAVTRIHHIVAITSHTAVGSSVKHNVRMKRPEWRRLHMVRGHVPPLLQMAGHRGTVNRRTTNKKLTKLCWPSRKRSPKD